MARSVTSAAHTHGLPQLGCRWPVSHSVVIDATVRRFWRGDHDNGAHGASAVRDGGLPTEGSDAKRAGAATASCTSSFLWRPAHAYPQAATAPIRGRKLLTACFPRPPSHAPHGLADARLARYTRGPSPVRDQSVHARIHCYLDDHQSSDHFRVDDPFWANVTVLSIEMTPPAFEQHALPGGKLHRLHPIPYPTALHPHSAQELADWQAILRSKIRPVCC